MRSGSVLRCCHASQGSDYFQSESARLERLLESGKVGAAKLAEISQKLSVLSAFSGQDESTRSEE